MCVSVLGEATEHSYVKCNNNNFDFELNPLNASFPSHLLLSVDHLPPSTCGLSYQKVVHGGSKLGSFVCHICNKSFAQKGNMTIHMRTHTGERPFQCSVCGKGFAHKSNMKIHMLVHKKIWNLNRGIEVIADACDSERKGYFCKICSFPRPSLSSLKKHMQTHSIRPYSCKVVDLLSWTNQFLSIRSTP
ncbi:hypothetical protein CEXT_361182 [Caerostris extrusa]|uniref:C2H2-type domain-containing protein n=1 Tax=Caerostris extrusa TaxID=172846 RepID=A0AAV4TQE0_CAEEX|nr:hypothetical protein CEXT_361182 [Caerostris extrusa]